MVLAPHPHTETQATIACSRTGKHQQMELYTCCTSRGKLRAAGYSCASRFVAMLALQKRCTLLVFPDLHIGKLTLSGSHNAQTAV